TLRCRLHGNVRRLRNRIAVDAAADRREGDAAHAMPGRQLQAITVTAGEQLRRAMPPVAVARTDRVDDELRRQTITLGKPCLSGGTTTQGAAFRQQFATGGAVDRAVHAAAPEQRLVGSVDD